ncbi:hypothetical protein MC885_009880 [Smutsia gigantea]|nr:hypothetical protein MC885_009880 [Smutsia gigantea]
MRAFFLSPAQRLGRPHVCSHTRSPAETTAATWDPARAHGADCPHPHPRRGIEADTPRKAREAKFPHRERGSPRTRSLLASPGMRPAWGRGRCRPAVALPGSATPLPWQPFPSEPVLRPTLAPSFTGALPLPPFFLPSLPLVWAGGGAG